MLPSLIDRLGDAKDSVREQDQTLLLKIMDQAANPQVGQEEWDCLHKLYACNSLGLMSLKLMG